MGFSEQAIKDELKQEALVEFELWPEHVGAYQLFISVSHQWRVPPFGGKPFGLDYPSVWSVLNGMFPEKHRRKLFRQLQLIEVGALNAWPNNNN